MIPAGIGREHVLAAMARIDRQGVPPRREGRTFEVAHEGRTYPPKLLVSVACEIALGKPLPSVVFAGGAETNGFLRRLGFAVASKSGGPGVPRRGRSRPRPGSETGSSRVDHEFTSEVLDSLWQRLLLTAPLHPWAELEVARDLPPGTAGVYAWFFRTVPPCVPTEGCARRDDRALLYVGISPSSPTSGETLRSRIRYHYRGVAEGSTLRRTLGCLLEAELGTILRRVGSGSRMTFAENEQALTRWMAEHAAVAWVEVDRPWALEAHLISRLVLPLNIEGNTRHPFHAELRRIREQARARARQLPILREG